MSSKTKRSTFLAILGTCVAVAVTWVGWLGVDFVRGQRAEKQASRLDVEARKAADQAEMDAGQRERQTKLARAVANRKSNEAAIPLLTTGRVPHWEPEAVGLQLAALGSRQEFDARVARLCPAVVKVDGRREPRDDFERRDRDEERRRLLAACYAETKAAAAKLPRRMVVDCPIPDKPEYDFSKQEFKLKMAWWCSLVDKSTWAVRVSDIKGMVDVHLILEGANSGGIVGDDTIWISVAEPTARSFNSRLRKGPTRLELAFELDGYGTSKLEERQDPNDPLGKLGIQSGHKTLPVTGFLGRAVAYRLVSGEEETIAWTPYGVDTEGRDAPARILFEPPPKKSSAQVLRDSMSPETLASVKAEVAKAHSPRSWKDEEQARFMEICSRSRATDPSINDQVCFCTREMAMERYESLSAYASAIKKVKGKQRDKDMDGWTGTCLAAFGD